MSAAGEAAVAYLTSASDHDMARGRQAGHRRSRWQSGGAMLPGRLRAVRDEGGRPVDADDDASRHLGHPAAAPRSASSESPNVPPAVGPAHLPDAQGRVLARHHRPRRLGQDDLPGAGQAPLPAQPAGRRPGQDRSDRRPRRCVRRMETPHEVHDADAPCSRMGDARQSARSSCRRRSSSSGTSAASATSGPSGTATTTTARPSSM
jgi:hypothetical protein